MKIKILATDGISKEGVDLLKTHPDFQLEVRSSTSHDELLKIVNDYDVLICRSVTRIDAEVIGKAQRLKLIVVSGAGYDNIDVRSAAARNIPVLNCPTANSLSAAEQTLGLMFSLARSIPQSHASIKSGKWERGGAFVGSELHGKVLGIIGLGNIGKIVAEKAMALGMLVMGYDSAIQSLSSLPEKFKYLEMRFKLCKSMQEVLAEADWVTMHIPKETRNIGLFNTETIQQMRKGSFLINASRGGIVDEAALLTALHSGHLAGAATDVFSEEPPVFESATVQGLLSHPRFIATAHLGGATLEAKERVGAQVATQILAFFNEGAKIGVIH